MSPLPKIRIFSSSIKTFHSSLFYHFWSFKNLTEWNSQCKNYHSLLFKSLLLILSTYISLKCSKNDWMRLEWGIFLKQGKSLNSKISSILLSFQHSDLILAKYFHSAKWWNDKRMVEWGYENSFHFHSTFFFV